MNFNSDTKKPLILVAPLDWGLGHTTRCIPIIQALLDLHCTVFVACNRQQKELLIREFPSLQFFDLPGYNIRYARSKRRTITGIVLQLPRILINVKRENRWLHTFLQHNTPDIIISDNRFGFYSPTIPSVFITHQLTIQTGLGSRINQLVQRLNYLFINRFSKCWIPDHEGDKSLAGKLSHPARLPAIPMQYVGALSRLRPCTTSSTGIPLLIILSGPEPQRTIFETQLLKGLQAYHIQTVLIRGLIDQPLQELIPAHVTVCDHVDAATLNQLVCSAAMVISRAGYTTIMDLLKLEKKSILVPTPGQAEQEYLAGWLYGQQLAYTVSQQQFNIERAVQAAIAFNYQYRPYTELYRTVIQEMVQTITKKSVTHKDDTSLPGTEY